MRLFTVESGNRQYVAVEGKTDESLIEYGHLKDDEFILEYTDTI